MDIKEEYLKFYKINFGQGRYCSKSWGLASYKAGQQSKQAEIDAIKSKLSDIYDSSDENETVAYLLDEIQELLK